MRPGSEVMSLPVGVIGFGWMGRVHAQAYARVRQHYPGLSTVPRLVAVADGEPGRAAEAAGIFGAEYATLDWHEVVEDQSIDAVSVTAPNFVHREIGCAVAESGKHLWIEKPVGLGAEDARAVAAAAAASGVHTAVGFNYRAVPAVSAARAIIADGGIGAVTHARICLFSDYAAHPDGALSWRFQRARGGHGVLGDLASHGADLAWFLLGDIDTLIADTAIFVPERSRPVGATAGHQRAGGGERGPVENEDYVSAQMRMVSGARCVLEASRVSVGEQNSYGFEVHGTTGMVRWDFRRMGELQMSGVGIADPVIQDQPVSTVHVGPGSGEYGAFQPGAANPMSYDDLKVVEAARFLAAIAGEDNAGRAERATIVDAVRSAEVLDAMTRSVDEERWVRPTRVPE